MLNKKVTITDIKKAKNKKEKISMITAYDYPFAKIAQESNVDIVLVGDSLGMVVLGYDDTTKVTMEDMIHHAKAVKRGASRPFMIVDMPFMSYGYDVSESVKNAGRLVKEGSANCVKLEGGKEVSKIIEAIVNVGIPVCAHIGYTPQSTNAFGINMVSGKNYITGKKVIEDALALEKAGASLIVLELVPHKLAALITNILRIPTIGIGAGLECDGQVLVINDMLGLDNEFNPKHNKKYVNLYDITKDSVEKYIKDVKDKSFPGIENSFEMDEDDYIKLRGEYGKNNKKS